MDRTTLIQQIRTELGSPLESELSTDAIDLALTNAVKQYARFRPKERMVPLVLRPDMTRYALDNVVRVRELITEPSTRGSEMDAFSALSLLSNPSLITVRSMWADSVMRLEEFDWVYQDGELHVSPAPTTEMHALARVVVPLQETDVPLLAEDAIKEYALGECMCFMGRKRNKKITEVPTSSGMIRFDDGAELRREGEAKKQDAMRQFGGTDGSAVVIG